MTDSQKLKKMTEVVDKASPGPWDCDITHTSVHRCGDDYEHLFEGVCRVDKVPMEETPIEYRKPNAQFIAQSRTMLPEAISIAEKRGRALGLAMKHIEETNGYVPKYLTSDIKEILK